MISQLLNIRENSPIYSRAVRQLHALRARLAPQAGNLHCDFHKEVRFEVAIQLPNDAKGEEAGRL